MRPYVIEFIQTVNIYFDIHVYSLGTTYYVGKILDAFSMIIGKYPFKKVITNSDIGQRFYKKSIGYLDIGHSNILIIDDRSDVWDFDTHLLYKIIPYKNAFEKVKSKVNDNSNYLDDSDDSDYADDTDDTYDTILGDSYKSLVLDDSNFETDTDSEIETDTNTETKTDTNTETKTDTNTETKTDTNLCEYTYVEKSPLIDDNFMKKNNIIKSSTTNDQLQLRSNKKICGRFTIYDIVPLSSKKKMIKSTDIELFKLSKLIEKYFTLNPLDSFNVIKFKNMVLKNDYFEPINFNKFQ
jgi:hypothetical protein